MHPTIISSGYYASNESSWYTDLPICENISDQWNLDSTSWQNFSGSEIVFPPGISSAWNVSCLEHAPRLTDSILLKAIILGIMAILSFLANVATIFSVVRKKRPRQNSTAIYTLIFHLSVADLFVTIFCIAGEAIWSYTVAWIWGNWPCKVFKYLQVFSLYLSTFVLVLIGVDRFCAVRYPMKGLNTTHRCQRFILLVWILSGILSIPQIIVFHVARGPFIEEFNQCVTHGFYTAVWQEQLYTSLSLFFMFVLPLAILLATYISTVITIARSEKMFKAEIANNTLCRIKSDVNRRRLIHRAKMKSLRLSIVIVAAFVIWWTPYYTMMMIFMFLNPDRHLSDELQKGIFFFGMSNSLVNPLIYGAFHLWPQRHKKNHYRQLSLINRRSTSGTTASNISREGREKRKPLLRQSSPITTTTIVNESGI